MAASDDADQAHAKLAESARTLKDSAVQQVDSADRRTELAADRTILAGYSMGGIGSNQLAMAHPDLFAQEVTLAGAVGAVPELENLRSVPVYSAGGVEDELGYCPKCQDASARPSSPVRGAAADPVPGSYSNVFSRYGVALARSGLSENTRRNYLSRTAAALRWAAAEDLGPTGWTDPTLPGRYRSYLVDQGRAAATVNAHLTAVEDFLRRSGIGQAGADPAGQGSRPAQGIDRARAVRITRDTQIKLLK